MSPIYCGVRDQGGVWQCGCRTCDPDDADSIRRDDLGHRRNHPVGPLGRVP